jgi:hypothetical protein
MFLTLEDPRAKVQGSRDPLGLQPLWSGLGRRLVVNLTTVSDSVRGFTTGLMARWFSQELVDSRRCGDDSALAMFLRTEQLVAYARAIVNGDEDFRGVERVRRVRAAGDRITIDHGPRGVILSDQKTYGLWGLYTVPSRVSGLYLEGPIGLTTEVEAVIDARIRPRLEPAISRILDLVARGGRLDPSPNEPALVALASCVQPDIEPEECMFYGRYLRDAAHSRQPVSHHAQATLASLLRDHTSLDAPLDRVETMQLAEAAGSSSWLGTELQRVARLEALLAPADVIFDHMLARHGQSPTTVASELADRWGRTFPNVDRPLDDLLTTSELEHVTSESHASHLRRVDEALRQGDFEEAIHGLLNANAEVMERRRSAPWIRLVDGRLDVRYRGTEAELPSGDDLPILWRNTYFIDSLKSVTRQLEPVD